MTPTAVPFFSDDIRLAGGLRLPDDAAVPLPARVAAPGFDSEQQLTATRSGRRCLARARTASPPPRETALSPPSFDTGHAGRRYTREAQVCTS
ncbi:hypothetical protein [Streptomyces sp. G1]|uniref:hypothetical protein n=1 Tax=Streptomyces sp. G1 TaxID=361572 RepID=UPI00202DC0FE|nr:hypothetical protein [Streptomyces sp. G1]MCM1965889.1 hypothetical protein [Streptomyces sp. G1]